MDSVFVSENSTGHFMLTVSQSVTAVVAFLSFIELYSPGIFGVAASPISREYVSSCTI